MGLGGGGVRRRLLSLRRPDAKGGGYLTGMPVPRKDRPGRAAGFEDLLDRGVLFLERSGPWPREGVVGLALSGGADSTFLALAWREFQARHPGLQGRAWIVDHRHRADSTEAALRACSLYEGLGLEARVLQPPAPPERIHEAALRRLRYSLLEEAAREAGAGILLMAHQADDQAETLLLRLARGTGLRGLAGIPAQRWLEGGVELRRPLLALRREEIRDCLEDLGQDWIEDPTNSDPAGARRNRVRQELLPVLAEITHGDPVQALLRLAAEARSWRDAEDVLLQEAGDWRDLPRYLRCSALADLLTEAGYRVHSAQVHALERGLHARGSVAVDGEFRVRLEDGRLNLVRRRDPRHDRRRERSRG